MERAFGFSFRPGNYWSLVDYLVLKVYGDVMNEKDYLAVFSSEGIHFIPREEKETHSTTEDCICKPEKDVFENEFVEKTNCYMHNSIPRGHANRLRMIKLIQLDRNLDLTSQQIEQVALLLSVAGCIAPLEA